MTKEITIVLADDHHVVRQGIRALLEVEQDFKIVGEVSDGVAATEIVEKLQPEVLVLDMMSTSGRCRRQRSAASRPLVASATTLKSGWVSSSPIRPLRSIGWSSATTMRIACSRPVCGAGFWGALRAARLSLVAMGTIVYPPLLLHNY